MVNLRRCHGLVAAADKVRIIPSRRCRSLDLRFSLLSPPRLDWGFGLHLAVQVVSRLLLIARLTAIPHATSMSDVSHLSYMLICPDATK